MMKKITTIAGSEFPVNMNDYHFRWRAFANQLINYITLIKTNCGWKRMVNHQMRDFECDTK
ncbi:hypothetical protein [Bacillus sp. MRMR6]|uniref:hypothetical protein n=1 Tax=Bacillus sp. MRMR6 TaxID=1928617 RepID=UPI00111521FE|nr:hypothetical protein [Bacillus sp. MRMR6]